MKNFIKNDDAVSVVVGAILLLAVMMTFLSVFTSSWVPIYEGDAEADHSDTTQRTFMDLYKQIEYADEFTNSATIDLGTDDVSFIKNSYSVGYLEVNESSGGLFLNGILTRIDYPESSGAGVGLDIIGLNMSSDTPLTEFYYDLTQIYGPNDLHDNYMFQMATTHNRWITMYNGVSPGNALTIIIKYGDDDPTVKWMEVAPLNSPTPYVNDHVLHVDLLASSPTLELINGGPLFINNSTGTPIPYNNGDFAPLGDIIQHWVKLGEGTYFINYMQYTGVTDGEVVITVGNPSGYNTTTMGDGVEQFVIFNNATAKIGGGTLTMASDYNFMVDQSYVYDNGAVFLVQHDGTVLKTDPPITASDDSGKLSLSFNTVELKGDLQASGNGVETLYTKLDGNERLLYGNTDLLVIVKETTREYYKFWKSHFDELNATANNVTNINATLINNTDQTNMTLTINATNNQSFYVTVNTKKIQIS